MHMVEERPCEVCGKPMICKRSTKKTCSNACRSAYKARKDNPRRLPKLYMAKAHKWCPRCEQALPLSEFYKTKDGRILTYCKPCKRRHQKEYKRKKRGLPPDAVLKGGREYPIGATRISSGGYLMEKVGTDRSAHPRADRSGWVYQHILVMEQVIGDHVGREFTIHHRNADRRDNRPENLELRVGQHGRGGDAIPTLLGVPAHRETAVRILEDMGYAVTPPTTGR